MYSLNHMTFMMVDDYAYCFSFIEGMPRLASPVEIIPSMAAHYYTMNGRLIAHGLVQLYLLFPPIVFDVSNSIVYVILSYVIYDLS